MLSNTKLKRATRLRALNGGATDAQTIRAAHSGARAKSRAGWKPTAAWGRQLHSSVGVVDLDAQPEQTHGASSDDIRLQHRRAFEGFFERQESRDARKKEERARLEEAIDVERVEMEQRVQLGIIDQAEFMQWEATQLAWDGAIRASFARKSQIKEHIAETRESIASMRV